jgi:hypothetical protein
MEPYPTLTGMDDPTIKSEGAYYDEARGNAAMAEQQNNPYGITKRVVQVPGMDTMTVMQTQDRPNPSYSPNKDNIETKIVKGMPKGGYELSEYSAKLGEKAREWAAENGVDINSPEGSDWYNRALNEGMAEGMKMGYVKPPASKNDFIETDHGMFDVRSREYVRPNAPQQTGMPAPQASSGQPKDLQEYYGQIIDKNNSIIQQFPGTRAADKAMSENFKIQKDLESEKIAQSRENRMAQATTRGASTPQSLRQEFQKEQAVKDYRQIQTQVARIDSALEENKKGGNKVAVDQALITVFNKMMDPTSVVRESEYARTSSDLSLLNRIKGKAEKIMTGGAGLTDEERNALATMAKKFSKASETSYKDTAKFYKQLAMDSGFKPEQIIRDLDKLDEGEEPAKEAPVESAPKGALPATVQPQSGMIRVIAPNGKTGSFPAGKPLPKGYKQIQ